MAERLEDAEVEVRLRYRAHGVHREYIAQMKADRFLPVVFEVARDAPSVTSPNPGGRLMIATKSAMYTSSRAVPALPESMRDQIDAWVAAKRREIETRAAEELASGFETIIVGDDGEVVPGER